MKILELAAVILVSSIATAQFDGLLGMRYKSSFQHIAHDVPVLLTGALIALVMFH